MPHNIIDNDLYFVIDPKTRDIINESGRDLVLTQYDHNSERLTFEIPRYIEGHDMSLCNVVQVHYTNTASAGASKSDVYEIVDLQVDPEDEEYVLGSWLVSQNATSLVGTLSFSLRFACVADEYIEYQWFTGIYANGNIIPGKYNDASVVTQYSDVLEGWKKTLFSSIGAYVDGDTIVLRNRWWDVDLGKHADTADHATNADYATNAVNAQNAETAQNASYATNAGHANTAGTAETATNATDSTNAQYATFATNAGRAANADNADHATAADTATNATNAVNAQNATNAVHATEADKATSLEVDRNNIRIGGVVPFMEPTRITQDTEGQPWYFIAETGGFYIVEFIYNGEKYSTGMFYWSGPVSAGTVHLPDIHGTGNYYFRISVSSYAQESDYDNSVKVTIMYLTDGSDASDAEDIRDSVQIRISKIWG